MVIVAVGDDECIYFIRREAEHLLAEIRSAVDQHHVSALLDNGR